MGNGLAYFKKVYDDVPGWVRKMHDYNPKALDHYTALRSEIMKEGHLSTKEKDLLLVGMNAARLYKRSMLYHTKGAIDGGATIPELAEYLLVSYIYNGDDALKIGLESLEYALALQGSSRPYEESNDTTFNRMIGLLGDEDAGFIKSVRERVRSGGRQELELKLLSEGTVSSKLKHILVAGIYMTELRGELANPWMEAAREQGAIESELVEVGLTCLLTAGIPAWFEGSDSMLEKKNSQPKGKS